MRKWLIAAGAAAVVAVAGVLTFVLRPDPPSDEECRDLFGDSLTEGSEFPAECRGWFESSIDELEQQAAVIDACQDAVVEDHAQRWTPELEFTSTDVEDSPGGVRVTGDASSVNDLGETQEWTYECTVAVDDRIRVLTVGTDRA